MLGISGLELVEADSLWTGVEEMSLTTLSRDGAMGMISTGLLSYLFPCGAIELTSIRATYIGENALGDDRRNLRRCAEHRL